jgi:hypothetical protein
MTKTIASQFIHARAEGQPVRGCMCETCEAKRPVRLADAVAANEREDR